MLALRLLFGICFRSPWSPLFPSHALALILPSLAKVRFSPTLTLSPLLIWYSGQTAVFVFHLARAAPVFVPSALSVALRPLFFFRHAQCAHVFRLKTAPFCTLSAGLDSTNKSAIFFCSPTILLSFCPRHPVLSSIFPLISNFVADLAGTVFFLLLFYQATMGLTFSEDTCLEKERVRSKVTPRKVGVGLKQRREPSRRRLGWRSAWWGSTEKKDASHLLGLRGRHQYSDQRYNRNRAPCVVSTAVGTEGEEDQMARSSA